ncbi:oligosaccharide flippase family protein [Enterococcus sp. AZ109]|uniref:oligosaccharide flippase family protein n=1 Tax=Enterococcus sp. AZ109 TaxID=2774634 RepID=UPI003F22E62F
MSQARKLLNDSVIFAIGSFGSKLITFFLVGFYTYYLTTSEYGTADLLLNSINLLLPVVSLSISEGVLRFVLDSKGRREKVKLVNTAILINFIGLCLVGCLLLGVYWLIPQLGLTTTSLVLSFVLLTVQSFQLIFMQYIKAIGKLKIYALNGILLSLLTLIFGAFFFRQLADKLTAYFLSLVLANSLSLLFLLVHASMNTWPTKENRLTRTQAKQLIAYSLPLIPNAAMWWILTTSSRFIMTFFLGVASSGMYAAASKIPNLLSVLGSIFLQAWQLSAVENYRKKNVGAFYQQVFNHYSTLLLLFSGFILLFLDPLASVLLSKDFYFAKAYIPLLLLSNFFSCMSGFFGTSYVVVKKTKGVLTTSLAGAAVNLVGSFLLIPLIGVNGASLASCGGFFLMFYLRKQQTKNLMKSQLSTRQMTLQFCLLVLQIGFIQWGSVPKPIQWGGQSVLLVLIVLIDVFHSSPKRKVC